MLGKKFMSSSNDSWKSREPWVVQDPEFRREWLLPTPLQYYVHKNKDGEWTIIDRWMDIHVGESHASRKKAIREFYKLMGRKIPSGREIPECPNPKHNG